MAFQEIVGQKFAKTILQNALKSKRLSHAYLFVGEEGLAKYKTAFEFTKAINCYEKVDNACGKCIACRKASSQNHPDIKEIYPDGASIKIDQIRKMQQEILYKPYESSKKVYIIHHADKMNLQAANSLLKTLEEPPSHAILILLASNIEKLLATIISRCQIVRFRLVADEIIKDKLSSNYDLDDKQAKLITSLASGRYEYASKLINNDEKLKERQTILDLAAELKNLNRVNLFSIVQKIMNDREELNYTLDIILSWYRDLLMIKLNQSQEIINLDYQQELLEEAKHWSGKGLEKIIKLIEETNNVIKSINVNLQLSLEVMFLRINRLRRKNYEGSNRSSF